MTEEIAVAFGLAMTGGVDLLKGPPRPVEEEV